jgi:hypothetical protein
VAVNAGDNLLSGFHAVLHTQSKRQISGWTAYGKVTPAGRVDALARPDTANAALTDLAANRAPQSNAPRTLCILRHCRKHPCTAAGASGRGTLLAQNAEQPELARADLVEALSADLRSGFRCCDQSYISLTRSCKLSPRCETTSDERSAGKSVRYVLWESGRGRPPLGHPVGAR